MTEHDAGQAPLIAWPAMIRLVNEVDVFIVDSWEEWVRDHDLSGYDEPGVLIGLDGQVYDLKFESRPRRVSWLGPKGFQRPVPRGERLTPEELLEFVRPQVEALGTEAEDELTRLVQAHDRESLPAAVISFLRARL